MSRMKPWARAVISMGYREMNGSTERPSSDNDYPIFGKPVGNTLYTIKKDNRGWYIALWFKGVQTHICWSHSNLDITGTEKEVRDRIIEGETDCAHKSFEPADYSFLGIDLETFYDDVLNLER